MDPRGGGGDEGDDEEDRGVEGGETPSVLGGIAQLTIAPPPLEEDRVNLNAPLHHGALHITMVPQQESGLNLSALPQYNTLPPPQNASLNVNAQPFVPGEMKRCTYCLERWPASMFSKSQWKVRKTRSRFRRQREPTANDDLKAIFAAFDRDGEPFTWRRCKNCTVTNKCLRGEMGLLKKTAFLPDMSFLDHDNEDDDNVSNSSGDEDDDAPTRKSKFLWISYGKS